MNRARRVYGMRIGVGLALLGVMAWWLWQQITPQVLPEGFASGNGRIEAVEMDIATTAGGRIQSIDVDEGDLVHVGQILATMDTRSLVAQRQEAEARLERAQADVQTVRHQVTQRESEITAAHSVVTQQQAALDAARKRLTRTETLVKQRMIARQTLDDDRAHFLAAQAGLSAARAQVSAAQAARSTAQSQVIGAQISLKAAQAAIQRIQAAIDDSQLKAPSNGRIQYRVAQPGEVLPAGGRVLNLVDLSDVYMTFFLPTADAGRVALGADVHLVLDAAPQYIFPATVSYVAPVAQFTPKTVETTAERVKLMFRIKAKIPPTLLDRYQSQVKTGLPGMAYVRLDRKAAWPEWLQIKLP